MSEETVCVKLNTDFETSHLNGPELSALVSAWQAGAISRDTSLHNLRQGEILPPGRTGENELSLIETDPDSLQKETKEAKEPRQRIKRKDGKEREGKDDYERLSATARWGQRPLP